MSKITIALLGNPNCGKTTLFNALTGANQHVGNWPGVTVERKEGSYRYHDQEVVVVDLPGIYSLDAETSSTGLDELVARDYLLSAESQTIVNILDASNLERNLYLTTQILEMGLPLIIVLNMVDLAEKREMKLDPALLSKKLGCPVIPLQAHTGKGVDQLKVTIQRTVSDPTFTPQGVVYPPLLEAGIAAVSAALPINEKGSADFRRWFAISLLQQPSAKVSPSAEAIAAQYRPQISSQLDEDIDILIADSRYTWIHHLTEGVIKRSHTVDQTISDKIDNVVLNRYLGIPIFMFIMYLMFMVSINFGAVFIDFFDIGIGTIFVDGVAHLLQQLHSPGWLIGLLANGVGGGLQTTSTFIPQIGFLFLFLAVLEDSGYLARAAFVMDRAMRVMGLPGKSFLPMIVGFGCNIPGIMATRTLENRRDRLMTILMNPFMSCGARLPVYALFCAAFFPKQGGLIVFSLYLIGILAAMFTGVVMKKTLFEGEAAPFVMELPPYHIPTLRGIFMRAWDRLKSFITKAGRFLIPVVVVLGLINSVGIDGSFGKQDSQDSILSVFSRAVTPVFSPMGIKQENWPATVGLFTGVFAKEVMVGTMDALYTQLARQESGEVVAEQQSAEYSLFGGLYQAVVSIPNNLQGVADQFLDPLGVSVLQTTGDLEADAATQSVSTTTFGQMASRFGDNHAAYAFLLFVLLYFPCVSATAAIYRETNFGWAAFVGAWTTGLAYWVATFYYQLMTFAQHPVQSLVWFVVLAMSMVATFWGLKTMSQGKIAMQWQQA